MAWTDTTPVPDTGNKIIDKDDWDTLWDNIIYVKDNLNVQLEPGQIMLASRDDFSQAGYLYCNGTQISRTTYADLFAAIGTMYGSGDGSTTFNLPDMRGRFLRQKDDGAGRDPDRSSRSNRGDGTTGDNVGTLQGDDNKKHRHILKRSTNTDNSGTARRWDTGGTDGTDYTEYTGGNENRPQNIYIFYFIKY